MQRIRLAIYYRWRPSGSTYSSVLALIFPATDESIHRAAAALAAGHLVGLPTETVYGVAANAWDAVAVQRIFAAKSRPATNPLIVHVAHIDRLADAIKMPPEPNVQSQLDVIADWWPGPLTVVCPRSHRIPAEVTAGQATVAVRIPSHPVALALLEACDFPLAAPSANRSKYVSPTLAKHLCGPHGIAEHLAMILDGGPCQWGVESTIIQLGGPVPHLLRPGAISLAELADRFGVAPESMLSAGRPVQDHANFSAHDDEAAEYLAPGMMRQHYSPTTTLRLLAPDSQSISQAVGAQRLGRIAFKPISAGEASRYVVVRVLSTHGDLHEVAHELFAALRELDESGLDVIECDTCEPVELGLAIMDRLHRAASKM